MVFKFVIIGDGGVGKTTLTKVFCNNPYVDQIMTIGIDLHTKDVFIKGRRNILQIWDISGQEQFKFMIPDFVAGAKSVIIAFDRTRRISFAHLDFWLNELRTHAPNAPIILISTKGDQNYHPTLRPEMAMEYAKTNDLIGFVETSAKLSQNVHLPFQRLLEHIYNLEPDTNHINFLGADEESKPIPVVETSESLPNETPPQSPVPESSKQTEISSYQTSPLTTESSRSNSTYTACDFCNSPLRQSQIKLKEMGKKVLCHNCFTLT